MQNKFSPAIFLVGLCTVLTACGGQPASNNQSSDNPKTNASGSAAAGIKITGAGASFVFPIMSKWSQSYAAATSAQVNYQSIGSGGGIAQIKANTVDFGSSDKPLTPEELAQAKLGQFPSVIGGVVPVVNLKDVESGKLKLTGQIIADIYLGKIKNWNDAQLNQLNPDIQLPDKAISPVYRSDGSGTTFNFTNYLNKISTDWASNIGEGTAVKWPGGFGGKGNEGVAAYVKQIDGALGYVELSYAIENKLSAVSLQNSAGNWIQPSIESFQAAAVSADWINATDFSLIITNAPGEQAWPIAATNFILISQQPKSVANVKQALEFFRWAYANGDQQAVELGYVPLPDALVTQIEAYWGNKLSF